MIKTLPQARKRIVELETALREIIRHVDVEDYEEDEKRVIALKRARVVLGLNPDHVSK